MTLKELSKRPQDEVLLILDQMKAEKGALPEEFRVYYEVLDTARIRALPHKERSLIFQKNKEQWRIEHSDFQKIATVMGDFQSNPILMDYLRQAPPPWAREKAINIYKKCISFKEKFSKRIESILTFRFDVPEFHYPRVNYCIDKTIVANFLNAYQRWNQEVVESWRKVYYVNEDFKNDAGYEIDWRFVIKHPSVLQQQAEKIGALHKRTITMLQTGEKLLENHDRAIMGEYAKNALEMSLFERELEIALLCELNDAPDEEYCYVYTLECEFFVFYVGIAGDAVTRVEQHIRGAFNDEAHLFKSAFIRKFQSSMKWKVIFEGTRRECKAFERHYIATYRPLGNMTEGGEG
jgi:hypothetical protein